MIENRQENLEQNNTEIYFIRHSEANYNADFVQATSENPTMPIDRKNQPTPDLTEAGIELARVEAQKLYSTFPAGMTVTFLTSNLQRANETARIYKEEALKKGLKIIDIDKNGEAVRNLKLLSLREYNPLSLDIFNPYVGDQNLNDYKWESVDPEYKKQWYEAYKYVRENGIKKTWGETYFHYSKYITENFPFLKIEDRETLFKKQFTPLIRMAQWALKKFKKDNVKVICFGHEDYVSKVYELNALGEGTQYKGIGNCEYFKLSLGKNNKDVEITA